MKQFYKSDRGNLKMKHFFLSGLLEEIWMFPAQVTPIVREVVEHAGFKINQVSLYQGQLYKNLGHSNKDIFWNVAEILIVHHALSTGALSPFQ